MAAITNARTGYRNGTTSGWAARSLFPIGDDLYAVVLDTSAVKIRVYKGTGDGTWTEQDSANAPSHSDATHSYDAGGQVDLADGLIYVAYRTATNTVRVKTFDTGTDTWGSDVGGANATTVAHADWGISVVVRSDGDVLVGHRRTTDGYLCVGRYEGASWAQTVVRSFINAALHGATITTNDVAYFWYCRPEGVWQQQGGIDGSNSVGFSGIDTTASLIYGSFPGYVLDGGTHRHGAMVRDSTGEADFAYAAQATVFLNPGFSIANSLTPTTTTDPGIMGGAVVPYNGQWHVIWSGDGRGEIHMDISDDYASPSFGTDTNVITGLSATDPAVYACASDHGVPVLYTDLTSPPAVDIVWAVGSPPAGGGTDDTGTVSAQAIPVSGGSVTGTAGQGATGAVTGQAIAVSGGTVTGTAETVVHATGTVTGQAMSVTGGTVTATAGEGDTGAVLPINRFANFSVETNLDGWGVDGFPEGWTAFERVTTDAYHGTAALRAVGAPGQSFDWDDGAGGTIHGYFLSIGNDESFNPLISCEVGDEVTVSVWIKGPVGQKANIHKYETPFTDFPFETMTGDWMELGPVSWTAIGADETAFYVVIEGTGGEEYFLDNAEIRVNAGGQAIPVTGGTVTGSAGATGIVSAHAITVTGGSVSASAGQAATGTVTGQQIPVSGGTVTGTAGTVIDATGTVTGQAISVTGGTVTATAGQADSATVAAQAIAVSGGTITATTGQGATGAVTGASVGITGGTVTADAGQGATGIVTGQSIPVTGNTVGGTGDNTVYGLVTAQHVQVTGGTVSATAGQGATGEVTVGTILLVGGTVVATTGQAAEAIVSGQTVTITGGTVTAVAGQEAAGVVTAQAIAVTGGQVTAVGGSLVPVPRLTATVGRAGLSATVGRSGLTATIRSAGLRGTVEEDHQ